MIIPAALLSRYLHPDMETKVCHPDGSAWRTLSGPAVQILADAGMVVGRGSRTLLKCCILLDDTTERTAEETVERGLRNAAVRGGLEQSQASRTIARESWSNHIGTVTVYRHIRGWAFGQVERRRQARVDAARATMARA